VRLALLLNAWLSGKSLPPLGEAEGAGFLRSLKSWDFCRPFGIAE